MGKRKRQASERYDPNDLLKKTRLNRNEAAFLLDVTPRTIDRYMDNGKIQYKQMPGGQRRPLLDSVKRYL